MKTFADPCVCGGSRAQPNADCERCQLVATLADIEEKRNKLFDHTCKLLNQVANLTEEKTNAEARIAYLEWERDTAIQVAANIAKANYGGVRPGASDPERIRLATRHQIDGPWYTLVRTEILNAAAQRAFEGEKKHLP